jgi:hypothetical protein
VKSKKEVILIKILIYDENLQDLSTLCRMIKILPIEYHIDTITSYEECINLYTKEKYDIVFIDFSNDIGKDILSHIVAIHQWQRIITISGTNSCSDHYGCMDCLEKYNKFRVVKPITENELFKIILKNELCASYCNEDSLLQLEALSKKFTALTLNKNTLFFHNSTDNYHRILRETIQLIYDLEHENIRFQLLDNGIQIIKEI